MNHVLTKQIILVHWSQPFTVFVLLITGMRFLAAVPFFTELLSESKGRMCRCQYFHIRTYFDVIFQ